MGYGAIWWHRASQAGDREQANDSRPVQLIWNAFGNSACHEPVLEGEQPEFEAIMVTAWS